MHHHFVPESDTEKKLGRRNENFLINNDVHFTFTTVIFVFCYALLRFLFFFIVVLVARNLISHFIITITLGDPSVLPFIPLIQRTLTLLSILYFNTEFYVSAKKKNVSKSRKVKLSLIKSFTSWWTRCHHRQEGGVELNKETTETRQELSVSSWNLFQLFSMSIIIVIYILCSLNWSLKNEGRNKQTMLHFSIVSDAFLCLIC